MTRAQIIRLLQEYPDLAHKILKMLPKREAYVIKGLYGLNGIHFGAKRPADVAWLMGITISRVYQLRRHGLILICHPKRKQIIVKYILDNIVKNRVSKTNQNILEGFGKV